MTQPRPARPVLWPEIRAMLLAAMAIFLYTIGIGILNGTDLVDFDQRRILGHVHGGTLGWLTLSVFAASLWLFGAGPALTAMERTAARWLAVAGVAAFVCYIAAFSLTYGNMRPVFGTISTLVIAGFFAWVLARAKKVDLGVPHWGFLAALGTSIVGGVLGILLAIKIANGTDWLTKNLDSAHPATMVVGFLVPVGLGMAEWAFTFPAPPKATRLGIIQMVFPFLGGLVLMVSLLADITPLAPIAILLQIIGFGIFIKRMWPNLRAVNFAEAGPGRHAVLAAVSLLGVIALAQYLVIKYEGDLDLAPQHMLLALDHTQFIGLMTNSIFAMLLSATVGRKGSLVDHVVFLAVNIGLLGFAVGLIADATVMKRIFAPIMGTGLLLGLAVFALRLLEVEVRGLTSSEPAPSGAAGQ